MDKSLSLDGTIFVEDVVYQYGSPQANVAFKNFEYDNLTSATIKWEFSNNEMIMSTASEYNWNGKSYIGHKREIYLGTYKYDSNGLLNFGEMDSKGVRSWEKIINNINGVTTETEDIYVFSSNNSVLVNNPQTESGWQVAQDTIGNGTDADNLVVRVEINDSIENNSYQTINDFKDYRVSTYYEENWQLDSISKSIINNSIIGSDLTWDFGSSRYHLFKTSKTWSEAQTAAEALGGKLVEVESKAENAQLFSQVSGQISTGEFTNTIGSDGGGAAYIWLGGSDGNTTSTQTSTEWNWKWSYSNVEIEKTREEWGTGWGGMEPDDSQSFQHRLALGLEDWSRSNPGKYGSAGQWNDINADNKLFYVVEVAAPNNTYEIADKASDLYLTDKYLLESIKDYDGNLHGYLGTSAPESVKSAYKYQGKLDVNADGVTEAIYTNQESGRWVTASIDPITGTFDYTKHGQGGTTRIVGIYEDPFVRAGIVEKDSDLDGSRTFVNDLKLDNLILKTVGDFDKDGY